MVRRRKDRRRKKRAAQPTGRGGTLGTPSHDLDEAPPAYDQEANTVVSGGGPVKKTGGQPAQKARKS